MDQYSERLHKIEEVLTSLSPKKISQWWIEQVTGESADEVSLLAIEGVCAPAFALLQRGGKRWRPLMMLLSCEASGGGERALPLVPLVEIPHTGSLIVDDIEDRSTERRGQKAVHLTFGEDLAINAGNLLYFLPSLLLETLPFSEEEKLAAHSLYSGAMRRLHIGQGLDIFWHREGAEVPQKKAYLKMCRWKTGALSGLAMALGARLAQKDPSFCYQVTQIGEEMGVGFQILDDVKNLREGNPGKVRGEDILEGKKSLPYILFWEENIGKRAHFQNTFSLAQQGSKSALEDIIALFEEHHLLDRCEKEALAYLRRAEEGLQTLFLESHALRLMKDLVRSALNPEKSSAPS